MKTVIADRSSDWCGNLLDRGIATPVTLVTGSQ